MSTSISDNGIYPLICEKAATDDNFFNNFKKDPNYKTILEHVSYEQGLDYLNIIKRDNPFLLNKINKFIENDIYGNPDVYLYEGINISPTTLRYMKVLSDLIILFENLDGKKIIEIGGGYGGQCKVISEHFNFLNYFIIDLDSASKLTKKYLDKLSVTNVKVLTMDKLENEEYDLVISNYAFTELHRNIQNSYMESIIKRSNHGYMTCNVFQGIDTYSKNELLNIKEGVKILIEEPATASTNYIIYW